MDGILILAFVFRIVVYGFVGIFLYHFFRVLTVFYARQRKPIVVYQERVVFGLKMPQEWEQAEVEKKDRKIAINVGIVMVLFCNVVVAFLFLTPTLWVVILTAWLFSAAPYVLPSLYKRKRAH